MTIDPIHATPAAIVDASYSLVSFRPGCDPRWDAFRSLFLPGALLTLRLFPGDDEITVMDVEAYTIKQIREGMKAEGYRETVVERTDLVYRDIAECRVVFQMKFGERPPHTAINIFQLICREGRWWIASVSSEILDRGEAVPEGVIE